ncbi:hypothetical protein [Streptomyces sp. NPDC088775]|uniref:hypothetical protein n=1 Tax=Streptomyces sp. NPDC088775 TaxID=3365896 RepID=UPI0037FEC12A
MTHSRRDSWFRAEGRKGKRARSESDGRQNSHLAPADPIKPYVYGISTQASRPEIPAGERPDAPADQRPALSSLTPQERRTAQVQKERGERLAERIARRVRKVKVLMERPVRRAPEDPTLRDELEYMRDVSGELLDELGAEGCIDATSALHLLRAAENMYALATQVEVVEDEIEISA